MLSKRKFRGCTCALFLITGRVSLGNVGHEMKAGLVWESRTEDPVEQLQLSTKGRTSAGIRYSCSYLLNKISSLLLPACLPPRWGLTITFLIGLVNGLCLVTSPAAQFFPCHGPCASWTPTLHLQRSMGWEVAGSRWSGERHSFCRPQIPKTKP